MEQTTAAETQATSTPTTTIGQKRALDVATTEKDAIVRLDVGGTRYSVLRSTLQKHPDSLLGSLFGEGEAHKKQRTSENGRALFFDRDGHKFRKVLAFYRDGKPIGNLAEATFWKIPWCGAFVHPAVRDATRDYRDAFDKALPVAQAILEDLLGSSRFRERMKNRSRAGKLHVGIILPGWLPSGAQLMALMDKWPIYGVLTHEYTQALMEVARHRSKARDASATGLVGGPQWTPPDEGDLRGWSTIASRLALHAAADIQLLQREHTSNPMLPHALMIAGRKLGVRAILRSAPVGGHITQKDRERFHEAKNPSRGRRVGTTGRKQMLGGCYFPLHVQVLEETDKPYFYCCFRDFCDAGHLKAEEDDASSSEEEEKDDIDWSRARRRREKDRTCDLIRSVDRYWYLRLSWTPALDLLKQ